MMALYQDLKKISQELITNKRYKIEKHNYKDCYMVQVFDEAMCLHCEVQYNEKNAEELAIKWLETYKEKRK